MIEKYFFSPSSTNFYPESMKDDYEAAGAWPADGIVVSESVFIEFAATPNSDGKVRGSDSSGAPVWINPPAPTASEQSARRLIEAQEAYTTASNQIAAIQQQIDDGDYSDIDTEESLAAEKAEWTDYRKQLRAYLKTDGSGDLPVHPL